MIIGEIKDLLDKKGHVVIAIEGFGGSGKSTLASEIKSNFSYKEVCVVSMDDFIIKSKVLNSWDLAFDRERLKQQVLEPASTGSISYQNFLWKENKLSEYKAETGFKILIVEGISAFHPDIEKYYDLKTWVDTPIELSNARGKVRDSGNENEKNWNKWSEQDQKYLEKFKSNKRADVIYPTLMDFSSLSNLVGSAKTSITTYESMPIYFSANLLDYVEWITIVEKSVKSGVKWTQNIVIDKKPTYQQLQYMFFLNDFIKDGVDIFVMMDENYKLNQSAWVIDEEYFEVKKNNNFNSYINSKKTKSIVPKSKKRVLLSEYIGDICEFLNSRHKSYFEDYLSNFESSKFLKYENGKRLVSSFKRKKKVIGWLVQYWLEKYHPEGIPESKGDYYTSLEMPWSGVSSLSLEQLDTKQEIGVKYLHVFATTSFEENQELLHKLHSQTVREKNE